MTEKRTFSLFRLTTTLPRLHFVSVKRIGGTSKLHHTVLFLLIGTLIVMIGGGATLFWQFQQPQNTHAEGMSVIDAPGLSTATIESIYLRAGSPMRGTGNVVSQASRATNIDAAFALAVWWAETNDGAAGVGLSYRNPGGVRSSASYPIGGGGYTIYPSYSAAITDWFNIVKARYINRGLTTVSQIAYPYVGTSGASSWAVKVTNLMMTYRGQAIPPTPTPSPTPNTRDLHATGALDTSYQSQGKQQESRPISAKPKKAPVNTPATQNSPLALKAPALPGMQQSLLIGLLLLSAILICAWVLKIRQATSRPALKSTWAPSTEALPNLSHIPTTEGLGEPMTQMLPLYVNQYSPVLVPNTSQLLDELPWLDEVGQPPATEDLPQPATSYRHLGSSNTVRPRRIRLQANAKTPIPSLVRQTKAGTEQEQERELVLVGSANHSQFQPSIPLTNYPPTPRVASLPIRPAGSQGTRKGGLLDRYGNG